MYIVKIRSLGASVITLDLAPLIVCLQASSRNIMVSCIAHLCKTYAYTLYMCACGGHKPNCYFRSVLNYITIKMYTHMYLNVCNSIPYLIIGFIYTHNEDQLSNDETNTQVDMNVVSHTPERPAKWKDMELHHVHDYLLMIV